MCVCIRGIKLHSRRHGQGKTEQKRSEEVGSETYIRKTREEEGRKQMESQSSGCFSKEEQVPASAKVFQSESLARFSMQLIISLSSTYTFIQE